MFLTTVATPCVVALLATLVHLHHTQRIQAKLAENQWKFEKDKLLLQERIKVFSPDFSQHGGDLLSHRIEVKKNAPTKAKIL